METPHITAFRWWKCRDRRRRKKKKRKKEAREWTSGAACKRNSVQHNTNRKRELERNLIRARSARQCVCLLDCYLEDKYYISISWSIQDIFFDNFNESKNLPWSCSSHTIWDAFVYLSIPRYFQRNDFSYKKHLNAHDIAGKTMVLRFLCLTHLLEDANRKKKKPIKD